MKILETLANVISEHEITGDIPFSFFIQDSGCIYEILDVCKDIGYNVIVSSNETRHSNIVWHLRVLGKG